MTEYIDRKKLLQKYPFSLCVIFLFTFDSERHTVMFKRFLSTAMIILAVSSLTATSQETSDSLVAVLKNKILGKMSNFSFGLYIDAYYNYTIQSQQDTSNLIPFSANCPIQNQIRMNVAAVEFYYTGEKVRGKLALQYGDAPNLLAAPNMQFIKTLRQANFGFRIVPDLWVDFGYLLNPVGYESSWAIINQISTVTIGGYFEPGSVLGAKLTYRFSPVFTGGIMVGNPFSLAYAGNTHMAGITFLNYTPNDRLLVSYINFFGNQAMADADIDNDIFYNNIIVKYSPWKPITFVGQLDVAFQTNSRMAPDTTKTAAMLSGFLQSDFRFNEYFSVTGRLEYFNDPHGFLSGHYTYDGKMTGLATWGYTLSGEYKPVSFGYIRVSYRYLSAQRGNEVFYSKTSDHMRGIIITAGVRF
jgi:hypothetical protein